jgi:hypothetical protein
VETSVTENGNRANEKFIEWPQGMLDIGFFTEEDKVNKCIELAKAMYEDIDSPLRWMKTFSKHLIQQSMTDPCIFYKIKNNKVVLIVAMYVDDTLCLGLDKQNVQRNSEEIQGREARKIGETFRNLV